MDEVAGLGNEAENTLALSLALEVPGGLSMEVRKEMILGRSTCLPEVYWAGYKKCVLTGGKREMGNSNK